MPLTIRNMEIFATGVPQRTPLIEFLSDETHLNSMVTNFANGMGRTDGVPLKFGHTSPTFNRKVAEALGMPEGSHLRGRQELAVRVWARLRTSASKTGS